MTTSTFSCPACGGPMMLFRDRNGKPYMTCRPCGTQTFVRNPEGVEKFAKRHGDLWLHAPVVGTRTAPAPKPAGTAAAPAEAKTKTPATTTATDAPGKGSGNAKQDTKSDFFDEL